MRHVKSNGQILGDMAEIGRHIKGIKGLCKLDKDGVW